MADRAVRILLVDDEPPIQTLLSYPLQKDGYEVVTAADGRQALERFEEITPDLVVLDVMMPRMDGLEVCRRLRARSPVPIIMLTATASPIDRVVGLELGADDYIPKPCELRELVARIRSVLRRGTAPGPANQAADHPTRSIRVGTKWFDIETHRLRDEAGAEQVLTKSEYALLRAFTDHPKRVLSRDRLLDLADARDPDAFDRSIDVRINRIRKKVEPDPANPQFIRTVRGLGYVFRPDGD